MLGHWEEAGRAVGWERPDDVWWAVLFHDAVYEVGRHDNEERSALLATDEARRWDVAIDAAHAAELIALTARHGRHLPDGLPPDAALFLDCDMAILGADPARYDAYERAVADEYLAVLPADAFARGRRAFLEHLAARERIFLSDWFHARLDGQARDNIRRALSC